MNVTDEAQVNAGIEKVVKTWGQIDVLISNAGIQIVHPLQDFPFDEMEAAVDPPGRRVRPPRPACRICTRPGSGSIISWDLSIRKDALLLKSAYDCQARAVGACPRDLEKRGGTWRARQCAARLWRETPLVEKTDPRTGEDLGISGRGRQSRDAGRRRSTRSSPRSRTWPKSPICLPPSRPTP